MAKFTVREVEGMRQIRIDLADEAVRTRRGAMSNPLGQIRVTAALPGVGDLVRGAFTNEARVRPEFSGTGSLVPQPSLGGYHVLDLKDERWILDPGVFWASDERVTLGLYRERFWGGLWAGDGPLAWKTTMSGTGRVAINAPGPVETVDVKDDELRVQGRLVLGRTDGLRFSSQRASTWFRSKLVGQKRLRAYTGTGQALVCWTPYWNQHMYETVMGQHVEGSIFE